MPPDLYFQYALIILKYIDVYLLYIFLTFRQEPLRFCLEIQDF